MLFLHGGIGASKPPGGYRDGFNGADSSFGPITATGGGGSGMGNLGQVLKKVLGSNFRENSNLDTMITAAKDNQGSVLGSVIPFHGDDPTLSFEAVAEQLPLNSSYIPGNTRYVKSILY